MNKGNVVLLVIVVCTGSVYISSCDKIAPGTSHNLKFKDKLSEYLIFTDKVGSLEFTGNYKLYEVSTPLFSDYAEKQRLIKIPAGNRMIPANEGLPTFPDSTIIVKTFYYYNNKKDTGQGKTIIETRLLIKHNGKWNAATYMWNKQQTDASLLSIGADVLTNWIDENGDPQVLSYHIPGKVECGICHQDGKDIVPIGLKLRNLNFEITHDGAAVNQLVHLQNEGIFGPVDPSAYNRLPDWRDISLPLAQRARAYLDINCGSCHHPGGYASGSSLTLTYPTTLNDSKIKRNKEAIVRLMKNGNMPLIGTTVIDKEGLKLIQDYIKTL